LRIRKKAMTPRMAVAERLAAGLMTESTIGLTVGFHEYGSSPRE
jgi:hypothetical protein